MGLFRRTTPEPYFESYEGHHNLSPQLVIYGYATHTNTTIASCLLPSEEVTRPEPRPQRRGFELQQYPFRCDKNSESANTSEPLSEWYM